MKKSVLAALLLAGCTSPYDLPRPQVTDLQLLRDRYNGAIILEARTSPATDACGYAINQQGYVPHERLQPFGDGYGYMHRTILLRAAGPVSLDVTAECALGSERSAQVWRRLYSR